MSNKIGKEVVVMRHGQDLTSFKYGTIVGSRNWGYVISRVATLLGFSQIAIVNSGHRSAALKTTGVHKKVARMLLLTSMITDQQKGTFH